MDNNYYLLLKWGTLKGGNIPENLMPLLKEYFKDGVSMSVATDRPDKKRKEILCKIIDSFDGPITNDWTGKKMSKEKAKKYVMEYDS